MTEKLGKLIHLPLTFPQLTEERLAENERAWADHEREIREAADTQLRCKRTDNLDAAKDCRLSDDVRRAIIQGAGLLPTTALEAVRSWRAGRIIVPWLALSGGTGCGKSVAAAWMVADCGGMWVRAERLARVFMASFGDQFDEQEQIRDCAFLVLDDIGSELDAARMTSVLIELLDSRKSRRQATLLTTNLGRAAFKERYGNERMLSRLHESVQWEPIAGADLRRSK